MTGFVAPARSLEISVAITDGDLPLLDRWARALDASLRLARPSLSKVIAIVADGTSSGLSPEHFSRAGPVDAWVLGGSGPGRAEHREADLVLWLSAAAEMAPRCLSELLAGIEDPEVGIVEPRWLPFQSAKPFDPTTMDVSWASAACCLVRQEVLAGTGGLDTEAFPGLGGDVDHSWRARLAGWSVRCVPAAAVFVHGAGPSGDPLLERTAAAAAAKLALAARYAGPAAASAWASAWAAAGSPQERQAADDFRRTSEAATGAIGGAGGELPSARAGDTDLIVQELFSLQRDDRGQYPLEPSALGRPLGDGGRGPEPSRAGEPFLSVVVRTQGRRPVELEDNLTSLAAQGCEDFEVLLACHDLDAGGRQAVDACVSSFPTELTERIRVLDVAGGGRARPLNAALAEASGRYVAFLDDDDVALDGWVGEFRRVAGEHPGAVAWTQVAWQTCELAGAPETPIWLVTEAPQLFVREFDLVAHLHENGTPNCGIAVPRDVVSTNELSFSEELAVFEDWEMVLRLAELAPFCPTGRVTALYRRGSPDGSGVSHTTAEWEESAARVIERLAVTGFFVRGEHVRRLHDASAELDELRRGGAADDRPHDRIPGGRPSVPAGRPISKAHFDGLGVVVVGAHLDDAVLSCGELLSGLDDVAVVTVFAGEPPRGQPLTDWDRACGFGSGDDVVAARIGEDDKALAAVGARPVRLRFPDEQYRDTTAVPTAREVGEALLEAVRALDARVVVFPLGIGHGDHRLAAAGALAACEAAPELEWFAYLDLPYGYEEDVTDELLEQLSGVGPEAVSFPGVGERSVKAQAISCYASQLEALGEDRLALALRPERYWRLHQAPHRAIPGRGATGALR